MGLGSSFQYGVRFFLKRKLTSQLWISHLFSSVGQTEPGIFYYLFIISVTTLWKLIRSFKLKKVKKCNDTTACPFKHSYKEDCAYTTCDGFIEFNKFFKSVFINLCSINSPFRIFKISSHPGPSWPNTIKSFRKIPGFAFLIQISPKNGITPAKIVLKICAHEIFHSQINGRPLVKTQLHWQWWIWGARGGRVRKKIRARHEKKKNLRGERFHCVLPEKCWNVAEKDKMWITLKYNFPNKVEILKT